jgi:3-hydroxybutyryl-CoA dehydrogenase
VNDINNVAIIGAGTMGRRIAIACVLAGKRVNLFDVNTAVLNAAVEAIPGLIETHAHGRTLAAPLSELLHSARSLEECVAKTELAIETVFENVEVKRKVFTEIDRYAPSSALIGTNTSSIPGSWLVDAVKRPEKVFNLNFGTIHDLKVEVMPHPGTARETVSTAMRFVLSLGLIPIEALKEIQGYPLNRIWRAVKKEVLFLLDGGYTTPENVDRGWMLDWKVEIGPCGLMDMIGMDVVRDIELVYFRATGDPRDQPPSMLLRMIEQGKLGVKTGEGFYRYPNPAYRAPDFLRGMNHVG